MRIFERVVWALAAIWAALAVLPASIWYDAGSVRVFDAVEGAPLVMAYAGGARREFLGSYHVTVRIASTGEVVVDDGSGRFSYHPDAKRPDPLTAGWWAPGDPRIRHLPPGGYIMETCWTVHGVFWGVVPGKTTCAASNIFTISPKG